jgi:hypothetical protein
MTYYLILNRITNTEVTKWTKVNENNTNDESYNHIKKVCERYIELGIDKDYELQVQWFEDAPKQKKPVLDKYELNDVF